MAETRLGGLDVDPTGNENGGIDPPQIVEGEAFDTCGATGRHPDTPAPLVVADGAAVGSYEHERVGVCRTEPATVEMGGEHLGEGRREAESAAAGRGFRGAGDRRAAPTPCLLLGHHQLSSEQIDAPDSQADRLTPAKAKHSAQPHDPRILTQGVGQASEIVGGG